MDLNIFPLDVLVVGIPILNYLLELIIIFMVFTLSNNIVWYWIFKPAGVVHVTAKSNLFKMLIVSLK